MRVVTRIEVVDIERDDIFRMHQHEMNPYLYPISSDNAEAEPMHFSTIEIRGQKFCRGRDDCVVIGWHSGVEDLLKLPLECFENVSRDISQARESGYQEGKNAIWNFLKINHPETDYWWLPIPIFLVIAGILA